MSHASAAAAATRNILSLSPTPQRKPRASPAASSADQVERFVDQAGDEDALADELVRTETCSKTQDTPDLQPDATDFDDSLYDNSFNWNLDLTDYM